MVVESGVPWMVTAAPGIGASALGPHDAAQGTGGERVQVEVERRHLSGGDRRLARSGRVAEGAAVHGVGAGIERDGVGAVGTGRAREVRLFDLDQRPLDGSQRVGVPHRAAQGSVQVLVAENERPRLHVGDVGDGGISGKGPAAPCSRIVGPILGMSVIPADPLGVGRIGDVGDPETIPVMRREHQVAANIGVMDDGAGGRGELRNLAYGREVLDVPDPHREAIGLVRRDQVPVVLRRPRVVGPRLGVCPMGDGWRRPGRRRRRIGDINDEDSGIENRGRGRPFHPGSRGRARTVSHGPDARQRRRSSGSARRSPG